MALRAVNSNDDKARRDGGAYPPASPSGGSAALERAQTLLAADPSNERLWRRCAELAAAAEAFDALLELARSRLANAPADPEGLFFEATALIGLRRFEEAIPPLGALLDAAGEDVAVLLDLGLCHYALGRYDAALPYLERCYSAGERGADLLRLLVSARHHVGMIEAAVELAREHLDAARGNGALAGVYALAFLDGDDPARAARFAEQALEHDPRSIDGLIVQGTLRLSELRTDEAAAQFAAVIERVPDNGRAWIGMGTAALLKRDFAAAKDALRRGVAQLPGHVGSWHVLAWTELVTGNLDEAERLFEHTLELDRNFSETHGGLAAVAALRGDRAKAEREIELANRLDPACVSAKFASSVLLGAAGEAEQAGALLRATVAAMTEGGGNRLTELLASFIRR